MLLRKKMWAMRMAWLRLLRKPRTRGFGVQSPWAYHMIRYVVAEEWPYHAYETLDQRFPNVDVIERRLGRLYLRLANYLKAHNWIIAFGPLDATSIDRESFFSLREAYVKAGCQNTAITLLSSSDGLNTPLVDGVLLLMSEANSWPLFEQYVKIADARSVLIVEDIHGSRDKYRMWKAMTADNHSGVSIDMYHCGIIFFDKSLYKQHYKVNLPL